MRFRVIHAFTTYGNQMIVIDTQHKRRKGQPKCFHEDFEAQNIALPF